MVTARDLMRPCPTVADSTTVAEVVARMAVDPEYFYAVLDAHGELTGIITEFDLVRLMYESGEYDAPEGAVGRMPRFLGYTPAQLRELNAASIMTEQPETVTPGTPMAEMAHGFFRRRHNQLLVAEGKHLLGVVRRVDVVKQVLG
ncbi:MAG: hypothetical protein JWN15_750 [Firmicutes bacterium]|nr:hypothetical protein [Bacillota bacterium]